MAKQPGEGRLPAEPQLRSKPPAVRRQDLGTVHSSRTLEHRHDGQWNGQDCQQGEQEAQAAALGPMEAARGLQQRGAHSLRRSLNRNTTTSRLAWSAVCAQRERGRRQPRAHGHLKQSGEHARRKNETILIA